jgi:O-acetyl-ADP-ribose deacetylase (regulator of RNase III)
MFIVQVSELTNPKYIVNFPTKRHWKGHSRIEDIDTGLESLVEEIDRLGIKSIAVPPLGCGLGGLDWKVVKPRIEKSLGSIENLRVIVFEPTGAPSAEDMKAANGVPNMTAGRATLIGLVEQYLRGLLDPVITLLEIHKLMYFMQEAGEPLKLRYEKALYGPYAKNLGNVLNHVEGHYLSGYADGGDAPDKELKLIPGAVQDARKFLDSQPATVERFKRVSELVSGFETPFGMELLASVHWVMTKEGAKESKEIVGAVYGWNPRKSQFTPGQIERAARILQMNDWV